LQLASADVQIVQPAKSKQAVPDRAEARLETPADIINARGFWDDAKAQPKQATPSQVAALNARQAVTSADPRATSSVSTAFRALAYAPAEASSATASASASRSAHAASTSHRTQIAANDVTTVAKSQGSVVSASTRTTTTNSGDTWLKIMMLAPSASSSMSVTVLGDPNMTLLSQLFVKPKSTIAMGFSNDPQMGLATDHFSGATLTPLPVQSFSMRTVSMRS
jgi:hypothetical protein